MTNEKQFQSYFLRLCPHAYRTALLNGSGFPDCLLLRGVEHFLIELKLLPIGPSGDKHVHCVYKPTQAPWHMNYLTKGGKSLYTVFQLNKGYGVVKETKEYVALLAAKKLKYSMLPEYGYKEYDKLTTLIKEEFE